MSLLNKFDKSVRSIVNPNRPTKLQTANVAIDIAINVAGVLRSEKLDVVFDKVQDGVVMRNGKKIKLFSDRETFVKKLLGNYKKKYSKEKEEKKLLRIFKDNKEKISKVDDHLWEKIKFNIKNNILWKNNTVDFHDVICHRIFIPYDLSSDFYDLKTDNHFGLITGIQWGLMIRIVVVNGILKLQVGEFDEETSPEILKNVKCLEYLTITSFPLIYASYSLIPSSYFNLSVSAIQDEEYRGKDSIAEWKAIKNEFIKYNNLFNHDEGDLSGSWIGKTMKDFEKKKKKWFKKESFDFGMNHIRNKYLSVSISDMNEMKDEIARQYTEFGNKYGH